jgi:hypothetical protein
MRAIRFVLSLSASLACLQAFAASVELKCQNNTTQVAACVARLSPTDNEIVVNSFDAITICQDSNNNYSMLANSVEQGPSPEALPVTLDDGQGRPGAGRIYTGDLGQGITLSLTLPGAVAPAYRDRGTMTISFPGGLRATRQMRCTR